jgi:hypothetical protein
VPPAYNLRKGRICAGILQPLLRRPLPKVREKASRIVLRLISRGAVKKSCLKDMCERTVFFCNKSEEGEEEKNCIRVNFFMTRRVFSDEELKLFLQEKNIDVLKILHRYEANVWQRSLACKSCDHVTLRCWLCDRCSSCCSYNTEKLECEK